MKRSIVIFFPVLFLVINCSKAPTPAHNSDYEEYSSDANLDVLSGLKPFGPAIANQTYPSLSTAATCNHRYSYEVDTKPIIDQECASCHSNTPTPPNLSNYPYLTKYSEVYAQKDRVASRVGNGTMPPKKDHFTAQMKQVILDWIAEGAYEKRCDETQGQTSTLVVSKSVAAGGTVDSIAPSDAMIHCGTSCSGTFALNTVVTLKATPSSGYHFDGWTGCDLANGNTCTQTLNATTETVAAKFVSDAPPPSSQLPRVDHIVSLPPHTITTDGEGDENYMASIGLGLKPGKTYYIAGSHIEAKDSKGNVHPALHHLLVMRPMSRKKPSSGSSIGSILKKDKATKVNPMYQLLNLYGGYVPGNGAFVYPTGTGSAITGDDQLLFSIHVNLKHAPPDADKVINITWKVMFTEKIEKALTNVLAVDMKWVTKPETMLIPANNPYVLHSYTLDPFEWMASTSNTLTLESTLYHMHALAIEGSIEKIDSKGQAKLIHREGDYNYSMQVPHYLDPPLAVKKGEKIKMNCVWDNSAANQPYEHGVQLAPTDKMWGEGTDDEMCMNVLTFTEPFTKPKK